MTSPGSLLCVALVLLAVPSLEPANAIEGTFSGTASGTINDYDGTQSPFPGEFVTGNFGLSTEIPLPYPDGCCDAPVFQDGSFYYTPFVFGFGIHAFGRDISNANLDYFPNGVTWADEGRAQSQTVTGGGPYWNGTLGLAAPNGGMFRNFDPATFDATRVDIDHSYFSLDDIHAYRAVVAFDNLTIDGYSQQVPEPASLGLFGAGLLMFAFASRRGASSLHRR
ncbi:MAG TPA: PEP-CTERM sorting domain-containing protein [Steroidobacteraceae bacterium]